MLYRTVYGAELEAIYRFVAAAGAQGQTRSAIHAAFVPELTDLVHVSTQNVDDALAFLMSAYLLDDQDSVLHAPSVATSPMAFRIQVLHNLRQLQAGKLSPRHMADSTYMLLLEELYAHPRQLIVRHLPVQANRLVSVQAVGGLNREKLQGWRRVMCYLGVGVIVQGEFLFAPDEELVMALIDSAGASEGSLQTLIEDHLNTYLPCTDHCDELTPALERCFVTLVKMGRLTLLEQQDAPSRPYGATRYRGYRIETSSPQIILGEEAQL